MNAKRLNLIRIISLVVFLINAIVLIGNVFEIVSVPDGIIRISGILTLITIAVISYTTVKTTQDTKENK